MLRSAPRHVLPPTPPTTERLVLPGPSKLRRLGAVGIALAFLAGLLTSYTLAAAPANAATAVGLFSGSVKPKTSAASSTRTVNVGMKFTTTKDGSITALQFYRSSKQKKAYTASLWDANGKLLGRTTFAKSSKAGWQTARLAKAVPVKKGKTYIASYRATGGRFAVTRGGFSSKYSKNGIAVAKRGGVYRHTSKNARPTKSSTANFLVDVVFAPRTTSSASTPPPPPSTGYRPPSGWPGAGNTGVPSGVTLSSYTGPSTITTDGAVIRNRVVNGSLTIRATNVQIINSRINGSINLSDPRGSDYSFSITDSEVHVGDNLNTGIMRGNFRATRVEVTGGRRSIYCAFNCVVEDSWVHLQGGDPGGDAHFSGIRMEQNGTFRHNTVACEAARGSGTGCSAALTGYGDFATVQNNLIENNIFVGGLGGGSTMCVYGGSSPGKPYPNANRIRFIDNVFVKGRSGECGNLGAVAAFNASATGNVWRGNTWDDGSAIRHTD